MISKRVQRSIDWASYSQAIYLPVYNEYSKKSAKWYQSSRKVEIIKERYLMVEKEIEVLTVWIYQVYEEISTKILTYQ